MQIGGVTITSGPQTSGFHQPPNTKRVVSIVIHTRVKLVRSRLVLVSVGEILTLLYVKFVNFCFVNPASGSVSDSL